MDSARLYKSASSLRLKYEETDVSNQGSDQLSSFTNLLSRDSDEEFENEGLTAGADTLSDTFEMLGSKKQVALNRQIESADRQFHKLHQLMIRHIFRLLFSHDYNKKVSETDFTEECKEVQNEPPMRRLNNYRIVAKEFTSSGYYSESEETRFSCAGQVKTSDGRSIDINMNVSMSRSFTSYYEKHFQSAQLQICDPLVINFDSDLANLDSEHSFYFDLDTDGEEEKIARLTQGSGFLALDINEDGKINDGSELFGPKSGNGFSDLAAYDEDHNGWIDENDSIFEKLKIWTKDENGNDVLYTLKEKDIGALYTGAVGTEFSLNDMDNSTMGYVRQTGLFLHEDGRAGTLQHIDMVS